ncbi:MAG: sugar transferase [Anaerolineaceae bacterium]|nr:sugar transferase [Anaerolineaceae bacterium]
MFDLLITIPGFILSLPVLGIVALFVRIKLGSPVIFQQERPGLNGKIFTLRKFRTMKNAFDEDGQPLPDDQRLTKFGRMLRSTSLDELPEMINVIRGEMSLVGPRPLLVSYLDLYSDEQKRRHHVLPGITGWAQINGRNTISWQEKFQLDLWYVDNYSVWLDIKILFNTFLKVVRREGIAQPGEATMAAFDGEN